MKKNREFLSITHLQAELLSFYPHWKILSNLQKPTTPDPQKQNQSHQITKSTRVSFTETMMCNLRCPLG